MPRHTDVQQSNNNRDYLTSSGCKPNSGKSVYHLHNRCSETSVKSPQNLALSNNSFYLYVLLKYLGLTVISTNIHDPAITFSVITSNVRSTNNKEGGSSPSISPVTTVPQTLHIHTSNIKAIYRQLTA